MPKPSSPISASPLNLRRTRLKIGLRLIVIYLGQLYKKRIKNNRAYDFHIMSAVILKNFQR
ncbi:hypothetical protein CWB85_10305 [Pseudoalteromonas sp. S1727]|nr:hypothetical protein [Pseudoalteromonas mariniglutinosa NCIMB 1770]TMN71633.1 hypothetical protein CWB85_10305 [Pseudoalteromonas sp. S1727]